MVLWVTALPRWLSGQEPTSQCRGSRRQGFNPWVGKIALEKEIATYSSIPAWEIQRRPTVWQRVECDSVTAHTV